MTQLAEKKCAPCDEATEKLDEKKISNLKGQLSKEWQVSKGHELNREYKFKDFKEALRFTNQLGDLAESLGHHPDIFLAWGKVKVTIFTHKVNGLTENDFVLAGKIDQLK